MFGVIVKISKRKEVKLLVFFLFMLMVATTSSARYTPDDVYAGATFNNRLMDHILASKGISDIDPPESKEISVKPMHVYELHISILTELYDYAKNKNISPPPLVSSTPINYSPTDVYRLTELLTKEIKHIYTDLLGDVTFSVKETTGKTPSDVYQSAFELYYKVAMLNGKKSISPNDVYSQIYRAKSDLQNTILTISKKIDPSREHEKRLLTTAISGMHPNGSLMPKFEKGKTPSEAFMLSLKIRKNINRVRKIYGLEEIKPPSNIEYSSIKPIDVFLQVQFIISELNIIKANTNIVSITQPANTTYKKTPSDVYYQMQHIIYMLERIIEFNE